MKTHGESKRGHEPWIRIERRTELTGRPALLLRFGTLLAALVAGGLFVLLLGQNPFAVYGTILSGTFKSSMSIVAVALGLGYGLGANSAVLVGLPQWVQLVFGGSGIVPAAFVAIVMNLLLPREKEA